jgi:hypothetical protein
MQWTQTVPLIAFTSLFTLKKNETREKHENNASVGNPNTSHAAELQLPRTKAQHLHS